MRDWHKHALVVVAAACIGLWLLGLGSAESSESFNLNILEHHPEACLWLAENDHPAALASNRFKTTAEALTFVEELYAAGAERVVVHNIVDTRYELRRGGPYARALIVLLPASATDRRRILAMASRELEAEGFGPVRDEGQLTLYLWWG